MEFFEHKHHKPVEPLPEYRPTPPFHEHPDDGYDIPMMRPCKPYVHGLSPEEQMGILTGKVNELIRNYNENTEKVYGAYNAIVESALCNDAYYNEVTVEEGYIAEAGAPYKVIHIPFLDRAKQPIFIELGLAYNNTTNANVHENVFSASERTLADKLIPAYQSTNTWYGAVVWKGAPISNIGENPADYTVGITENGFIKVYEHLINYGQLQQDRVRNAMLANSILVQGGKMTPDKFFPDEKDQLIGRVGIGMNYDTKERFMVIVNGSDTWGCTTEMLANIFLKYNCTVAVEVANGMKTTALDKGALLFTPPTVAGDEVPTIPEVNAFWYITKRRHYHNEYVKDVASLTQKYGQMLWRCETANISVDNVKEEVANLSQKLDTEIANREEGDNNLQEQITQEVADREQGDETLDNRITQEVQTLNDRIDTEVETLNKLIADTKEELQTNIDNLDAKVEQYHTELDNADIASVDILQDGTKDTYRLKRKDGTYVDIPMEVYNYELLLQKLDTLAALEPRLEQEIQARKDGDTNLQNQINDLTDDMTEKDNQLLEAINEETQNRVEAIQAETQARQQADNTLQQNINNEAATRLEGDTALQQKIDELTGEMGSDYVKKAGDIMTGPLTLPGNPANNLEATPKQYVDTTITQAIAAEASEREKQDGLLEEAINQEAITREQADTNLDNRVQAVEQAMTQFDNKVIVVGDTTLIGEGVTAIGQGKVVLWVRENKDAVVLTAYDADAVMFKGYTMEQPAFVTYTYANTGVAFSTGTEAFLSPVVGTPTDENQAVNQSYVTNLIEQNSNVVIMNWDTATLGEIKSAEDSGKAVIIFRLVDTISILLYIYSTGTIEGDILLGALSMGSASLELYTVRGKSDETLSQDNMSPMKLDWTSTDIVEISSELNDVILRGIKTPVNNNDAANKQYVDEKLSSAVGGDFKADGSVSATGDFNMGGHAITNVEAPTNDSDVSTKGYTDSEISEAITEVQNQFEQAQNVVIFTPANTLQDIVDNKGKFIYLTESESDPTIKYYIMPVYRDGALNIIMLRPVYSDLAGIQSVSVSSLELTSTIENAINNAVVKLGSNIDYNGVDTITMQTVDGSDVILSGIKNPTSDNHAVNKGYADSKYASVYVVTSGTVLLSQISSASSDKALIMFDGVSVEIVDRHGGPGTVYTLFGEASVSDIDGTYVTIICGDVIIRGSGQDALNHANLRMFISDIIDYAITDTYGDQYLSTNTGNWEISSGHTYFYVTYDRHYNDNRISAHLKGQINLTTSGDVSPSEGYVNITNLPIKEIDSFIDGEGIIVRLMPTVEVVGTVALNNVNVNRDSMPYLLSAKIVPSVGIVPTITDNEMYTIYLF